MYTPLFWGTETEGVFEGTDAGYLNVANSNGKIGFSEASGHMGARNFFKDCTNIDSLTLRYFDFTGVTSLEGFIDGCTALETIEPASMIPEGLSISLPVTMHREVKIPYEDPDDPGYIDYRTEWDMDNPDFTELTSADCETIEYGSSSNPSTTNKYTYQTISESYTYTLPALCELTKSGDDYSGSIPVTFKGIREFEKSVTASDVTLTNGEETCTGTGSSDNVGRKWVNYYNYEPLSEKPEDWDDDCYSYYYYDEDDGNYYEVDTVSATPEFVPNKYYRYDGVDYVLLDTKPDDWDDNYESYYKYYEWRDGYDKVYCDWVSPEFEAGKYYAKVQASDATCNVTVSFSPTGTGTYEGSAMVTVANAS